MSNDGTCKDTSEHAAANHGGKSKVLLIGANRTARKELACRIRLESDFELCGQVGDAASALLLINFRSPDIALIDLVPNEVGGLELIRQIHALWPALAILALTGSQSHDNAVNAGAKPFVGDWRSSTGIISAIRELLTPKTSHETRTLDS